MQEMFPVPWELVDSVEQSLQGGPGIFAQAVAACRDLQAANGPAAVWTRLALGSRGSL
jgi:hypothetical protein